jgi:glycolate oxidase FAD binding subunit
VDLMADPGAALAAVVGAAHVHAGSAAAAYGVDGRTPRWVVEPGSVEEVSGCLALATSRGLAVAPAGHGTRRHWGQPPRALDLVLSLRRLDRILAHEPADLTCSVEAGVTLGQLDATLRPHRQFLPLDPPRADTSTVGGVVASAASGPYRARYGTIRDALLGLTVVQADGTVVKGGGRVVKNVTGYDMPKLYVGALGTLGVVVSAHLRLHAQPAAEITWAYAFPSAEEAHDAALAVMDAPVVVSRLQLVWEPDGTGLGITVGSVPDGVRAQGERIAAICAAHGGTAQPVDDAAAWWAAVRELAWPDAPACLLLRIGVRPTDVVKALRAVEAATGPPSAASAMVVNGVLHVRLAAPADAVAAVSRVRAGLAPLRATCVVEHAPTEARPRLDAWGDVGPGLDAMRRLKAELDPHGTLNPGRYVGGI